jgi:hypothetical protein
MFNLNLERAKSREMSILDCGKYLYVRRRTYPRRCGDDVVVVAEEDEEDEEEEEEEEEEEAVVIQACGIGVIFSKKEDVGYRASLYEVPNKISIGSVLAAVVVAVPRRWCKDEDWIKAPIPPCLKLLCLKLLCLKLLGLELSTWILFALLPEDCAVSQASIDGMVMGCDAARGRSINVHSEVSEEEVEEVEAALGVGEAMVIVGEVEAVEAEEEGEEEEEEDARD